MKKGISQLCYEGKPIRQFLTLAKKANFEGVELTLKEEGEFSLASSENEIKAIKKEAKEIGLEIPSIASELFFRYPLFSLDEEIRRKARDILKRIIEVAAIMGADTILVIPGRLTREIYYDFAYQETVKAIEKVIPVAEKHKVYIGIENIRNKIFLSPLEFAKLIDDFQSQYVVMYLDPGNVLRCEGFPEHWIKILNKRIKKVHVKDYRMEVDNSYGYTHLLQGDVNWPLMVEKLKKVGYDNYLIVELPLYRYFPEKMFFDTSTSLDRIIE